MANCKVQMPDVPSTTDMNEAYYKFGDCSIAVANVKEYLYQARIECDDKAGFDSPE